jgi:hypothetical protein
MSRNHVRKNSSAQTPGTLHPITEEMLREKFGNGSPLARAALVARDEYLRSGGKLLSIDELNEEVEKSRNN